jgi:hypothetical protein
MAISKDIGKSTDLLHVAEKDQQNQNHQENKSDQENKNKNNEENKNNQERGGGKDKENGKGKGKVKKKDKKEKRVDIMKRGIEVLRDDVLEDGSILKCLRPSTTLLNPFWYLDKFTS